MGGAIGFTLREENGKEHRMCRWTNILTWAVDNMRLVNKDPAHIKEIIDGWDELAEDYDNNVDNMSQIYVPGAGLNPVEYGLVVVDLQNNVILDMQNYHHISHQAVACFNLHGYNLEECMDESNEDLDRIMEFVKAGRVKTENNIKIDNKKQLLKYILNKKHIYDEFILDMSPFVIKSFDDVKEIHKAVTDLGFVITEEEEKIWKEYSEGM